MLGDRNTAAEGRKKERKGDKTGTEGAARHPPKVVEVHPTHPKRTEVTAVLAAFCSAFNFFIDNG